MPIYVFRCEDCGEKFDRLQKLSDPDPETCPNCGKHRVRRQVTAPAFRLAGSGWYETDFKSDREKKHNLADNGAGKPGSSGDKSGDADKGTGTAKGSDAAGPSAKPATADKPAKSAEG